MQTTLLLLVLLGFASLGAEVSQILLSQRREQTAADAAALAAAAVLGSGDIGFEARSVAGVQGFQAGANSVTVTVNNPPASGAHAADANYVEVIIHKPRALILGRLAYGGSFNVSARAVAKRGSGGQACILGLDPTAANTVQIYNNAIVNTVNCGVGVNSSSSSGFHMNNNAVLNGSVVVSGPGAQLDANSHIYGQLVTSSAASPDPYAGYVVTKTTPACTAESGMVNSTSATLHAGHFCNGWNFSNKSKVTLSPGLYYVDTAMSFGSNVTVSSSGGVTIILNNNLQILFGPGVTLNLAAQTGAVSASNPAPGIVFYSRPGNGFLTQSFNNNAALNVSGALYFPSQKVVFDNNTNFRTTVCTQLIARQVSLNNNMTFQNACSGSGVLPIGLQGAPRLAE